MSAARTLAAQGIGAGFASAIINGENSLIDSYLDAYSSEILRDGLMYAVADLGHSLSEFTGSMAPNVGADLIRRSLHQ